MAKEKNTCPECGGPKRGRGFAHEPGCKKVSGSTKRKGRTAKTPATPMTATVIDGRMLRGMTPSALLDLREKVDAALATKAPEIDKEIERLKALKASIKT